MPAPAVPRSQVERAAALYFQAVEQGAVPLKGAVCSGRTSFRTVISEQTGWTVAEVGIRIRDALRFGLIPTDSLDDISDAHGELPPARPIPAVEAIGMHESVVLVGGDLHAWPGRPHPIWWAFVMLAERLRPKAIVLNGDVIDGARISRHPKAAGWTPRVVEEIEAVRALIDTLPPTQHRLWTVGNHDIRVSSYLANMAPEMDDFAGTLQDRFPEWRMCWSVRINGCCEIRHRFRSGIHAPWNNSLHSGLTMVTGHSHQLESRGVVDRNGRRWGVEGGMLADPEGPQFEYTEWTPRRWTPGFVVLTFDADGMLQPPELCEWRNGQAWFRGEPVKPRIRVKAGRE